MENLTTEITTKKQINLIAEYLGYKKLTKQNTFYVMQKIWRYWEDLRDFFGYCFLMDCWLYLKKQNENYYNKIMEF